MPTIDRLSYESRLRFVHTGENFLFAVHSASLCGQPLHPSGRLCIYDNWDPDCLQGQNPSY